MRTLQIELDMITRQATSTRSTLINKMPGKQAEYRAFLQRAEEVDTRLKNKTEEFLKLGRAELEVDGVERPTDREKRH